MLVPQIEYLYYPLNVEGVTQAGLLLPAHKSKTNNNNINIYICQSQFFALLDKNKNQLKLAFLSSRPKLKFEYNDELFNSYIKS